MKPDEEPVTDFGQLMQEEKERAKEEASLMKEQHEKDLQLAKELQQQLLENHEEELLKQAIAESLKLENEKQKPMANDGLGVTYKQQKEAKGRGKRTRGGRKSAQV